MNETKSYVTVKLLFFAKAREYLGQKEVLTKVPNQLKGKDLLDFVVKKYQLEELKCNIVLAINECWIDPDSDLNLKNLDEIAVVPPLSGAFKMNYIKLTKDILEVESICKMVSSPEFGAVSIFIGTTRNSFEGETVLRLEYEAYEGMAVKSLEKICQNIRQKFDVGNIAMFHRLGDVPIQEASVVIAISSKHRKPALEALPFAIDALKADVPIWKKEVYKDGKAPEWKENAESSDLISQEITNCVQLYEEVVEANIENEIPFNMIQINANLQEINRRISSFIKRKREQIDVNNIEDFGLGKYENSEESTCARVSAILMRRKDSKSHLKVHKVENIIGPQTHGLESTDFSLNREKTLISPRCPPGAEERLVNAERYLNLNSNSKDVFSRLKAIEDKILYLESISPEYFDFEKEKKLKLEENVNSSKKTYSCLELDVKMQQLEAKLQRKLGNGN